jgi:hypothetical protein
MKKITIKTRLHNGIYASSGGGKTIIHYVYNVGPKNLLMAVKQLHEHRASMSRSYGNIGCGGSWIEIDGLRIDNSELPENMKDARQLIDDINSGELLKNREWIAREYERLSKNMLDYEQ